MTGRRAPSLLMLLTVALGTTALPHAQTATTAEVMLEKAVQMELVDGDLTGAIDHLERILVRFADDRAVTGQALWHLGQCYERLADPRAREAYTRLLREYADGPLSARARTRLEALSAEPDEVEPAEVLLRESWSPPAPYTTVNRNLAIFSDLAVFDRRSGESRRLTSGARATAYPVVSPDRQYVAYVSWSGDLRERLDRSDGRAIQRPAVELRVVRMDGTDDRTLFSSNTLPWLRPFDWSPDGRYVLTVIERRDETREIALVNVADGSLQSLTSLPWLSPQGMGFSPDGSYIAYEVPTPRSSRQQDFFILPVEPGDGEPSVERRYSMARGAQAAPGALTEEQVAVHVLNRLGFGPRPGDIERVIGMGVEAYIEEQLHPERLDDRVVTEKLASFRTLRMDIPELLERTGPVVPEAARARSTIFERRAVVGRPTVPPLIGATAADATEARTAMFRDRPRDYEIHTARAIRAVHSERQLFEVVVDFWMNHFSINHGDDQLTAHFEEQAVRRHALGRFEDLLVAVARHPRMLFYLDNWRSSAPAEVVEARLAELKSGADRDQYLALLQREPFFEQNQGLNENFARELMELHTLGVDGGYSQQDVEEVAKVLTGWTISGEGLVNGRENDGVFAFDPLMHVEGDKTVLGRTIPSGGIEEGEQLLRMLAAHPSTARFISTKLVRRFVADDPPQALVDAAARTFEQTGGDIRQVLETILTSRQFQSVEAYEAKIKKPLELVVSSLRASGATPGRDNVYTQLVTGNQSVVVRMGERVYNYEAPDGNPDVASAWMNSNALLARLEFANRLATGQINGIEVDLSAARRLLEQLGLPRPSEAQIEQTRAMLEKTAARESSGGMRSTSMAAGGAPGSAGAKPIDPEALVVAAMLGSPEFQKR